MSAADIGWERAQRDPTSPRADSMIWAFTATATLSLVVVNASLNGFVLERTRDAVRELCGGADGEERNQDPEQGTSRECEDSAPLTSRSSSGGLLVLLSSDIQATVLSYRSLGSLVGSLVETLSLFSIQPLTVIAACGALLVLATSAIPLVCSPFEQRREGQHGTDSTAARARVGRWNRREVGIFTVWLVFVVLYTSTPTTATPLFHFFAIYLKLPNWILSLRGVVALAVGLLSVYVMQRWFNAKQATSIPLAADGAARFWRPKWCGALTCQVLVGSIAAALGAMSAMVVVVHSAVTFSSATFWRVIGQSALDAAAQQVFFFPVMTVMSVRTIEGWEATSFELFSLAAVMGGGLSQYATGLLVRWFEIDGLMYHRFWAFSFCCAASKLVLVPVCAAMVYLFQ